MAITSFHPTDGWQTLGFAVVQQACDDFIRAILKELKNGRDMPRIDAERYNYCGRIKTIKDRPRMNNSQYDAVYVESLAQMLYWVEAGKGGYWKEMPVWDDVAMFILSDSFAQICPHIEPKWLIKKLTEEAKNRYDCCQ